MSVLLGLLLAGTSVRVVAIKAEPSGVKQKVSIEASGEWGPVSVSREGDEVVAALAAEAEGSLAAPDAEPPLRAIRLQHTPEGLQVRVAVAQDVPFAIQRNGRLLVLLFGPAPPPRVLDPRLMELYRGLRPGTDMPVEPVRDAESASHVFPGIALGSLRLQPSLVLGYVRTDVAAEEPTPVREEYFQFEPRLGTLLQVSLWQGHLKASYEPRVRILSRLSKTEQPDHQANVSVEVPLGSRLVATGSDHYVISTLDTVEADPGREYFYDLGRFTKNSRNGSVRMDLGPRIFWNAGASTNHVRFKEAAGFNDYDENQWTTGLGLLLGPSSSAQLSYVSSHVPPLPRQVTESTADSLGLTLSGELIPRVEGQIRAGYERRTAPNAGPGGQANEMLSLRVQLTRELSAATRLSAGASRASYVSAFEQNAFYVGSGLSAAFETQAPLDLSVRAGGGYHWNSYLTLASEIGEPRRDQIAGWTIGVGRSLRPWCYVRADYAREWRHSNLKALENRSSFLSVSVGIGWFKSVGQP